MADVHRLRRIRSLRRHEGDINQMLDALEEHRNGQGNEPDERHEFADHTNYAQKRKISLSSSTLSDEAAKRIYFERVRRCAEMCA